VNQQGLIDYQLPLETRHYDLFGQRDSSFRTLVKVQTPLARIAMRPQNPDRAASYR
jgi:hypothetical protein